MMKFKKNITAKVGCVISEALISCIPAILIITIFIMNKNLKEVLLAVLVIPYFLIIINIILFIFSCVGDIFDKTIYTLEKDSLIINTRQNETKINYSDIKSLTFDYGSLEKFNRQKMQLILFGEKYKQLLILNNHSILMTCLLRKKCNSVKICYYNNKRILFLLGIINITILLVAIIIKITL